MEEDSSSSGVRLISFCFILALITTMTAASYDESSSTCLTLYEQGGAPAVFQSPKCPRWKRADSLQRCQTAVRRGRRNSLEDRALCALDLRIPFPGELGIKEVKAGIVAVFDVGIMVLKQVIWLQGFYWSVSFCIPIFFLMGIMWQLLSFH